MRSDKPTIKNTVVIMRITAQACGNKDERSRSCAKIYNDTADVLEAIGAAYEDLYASALIAVQEGDLTKLRAHIGLIEREAKKVDGQQYGAA